MSQLMSSFFVPEAEKVLSEERSACWDHWFQLEVGDLLKACKAKVWGPLGNWCATSYFHFEKNKLVSKIASLFDI